MPAASSVGWNGSPAGSSTAINGSAVNGGSAVKRRSSRLQAQQQQEQQQQQAPEEQQQYAASQAALAAPARPRGKSRLPAKQALASWHSVPSWLRDNEYITSHYRVGWSPWQSVKSLFQLHNESGNVWTHLLGFLIFLALTVGTAYLRPAPFVAGKQLLLRLEGSMLEMGQRGAHDVMELERRLAHAGADRLHEFQAAVAQALDLKRAMRSSLGVESFSELEGALLQAGREGLGGLAAELAAVEHRLADYARSNWRAVRAVAGAEGDAEAPVARWPVYVFTSGAMVCLLTSTMCHLFGCCSRHVALWIWRLDYAGIAVLIVTSFYPPVYYCFQCYPRLQVVYLAITTAMGIATLCASLLEVFQQPAWRPMRAGMYAALGLWGIVPILHGAWLYGGEAAVSRALALDVLMGAVYLGGAWIYAMRVPERYWPGRFDLWAHSHQLFHVAVVVAALIHYKATLIFVHWRDTTACPPLLLA